MQLCFFKAKYGNCWDKLISWWTKSPYSHVELKFSDGICFSSSTKESSVRFLYFTLNKDHWDIIDIPNVSKEKEKEIRDWCQTQVGKGYDWFAIFGYIYAKFLNWIPFSSKLDDSNYWYCSEVCIYPLIKFGILNVTDARVAPGCLYTTVKNELKQRNLYAFNKS